MAIKDTPEYKAGVEALKFALCRESKKLDVDALERAVASVLPEPRRCFLCSKILEVPEHNPLGQPVCDQCRDTCQHPSNPWTPVYMAVELKLATVQLAELQRAVLAALMLDQTFSLGEVLDALTVATQHLQTAHDCDCNGYELNDAVVRAATTAMPRLRALHEIVITAGQPAPDKSTPGSVRTETPPELPGRQAP